MTNGDDGGITPPEEPPATAPSPLEIFSAEQVAAIGRIITRSPFYVDDGTFLRITVTCGLATAFVRVGFRTVDPNGRVTVNSVDVQPGTAFLTTVAYTPLSRGLLFNVTATLENSSSFPISTFVVVQLVNGRGVTATALATLVSNYIAPQQPLGWPGTPVVKSIDGPGTMRQIQGTFPAAGAEIQESFPVNVFWRLHCLEVLFTADNTVTTRVPTFLTIGAGDRVSALGGIVASQIGDFTWGAHFSHTSVNTGVVRETLPYAGPQRFTATQYVTQTVNIQPGDQYGTPRYTVEEWFTGVF